jgi:PPK2 family polyphosphate:nucleotide phosphotransferase
MKPILFEPVASPFLVPYDGTFRVRDASTKPPSDAPGKKDNRDALEKLVGRLDQLQRTLYAHDRYSILLVFQAMDAAGKDGTIRAVLSGVNPAGCHESSFKVPSDEELDHDFLWRINQRLPQRGKIGVFNRSHYEEVLAVRVHPEYLGRQRLPRTLELGELWKERYESIREAERHIARSGTVVLKFWLNVSKDEQRDRFLERIDNPEDNWKFSARDLDERALWNDYMVAYEDALNATSRPWAPWYAVPADSKSYMRRTVADIVVKTLDRLDMRTPALGDEERAALATARKRLLEE